jgi:hypothetical protein
LALSLLKNLIFKLKQNIKLRRADSNNSTKYETIKAEFLKKIKQAELENEKTNLSNSENFNFVPKRLTNTLIRQSISESKNNINSNLGNKKLSKKSGGIKKLSKKIKSNLKKQAWTESKKKNY